MAFSHYSVRNTFIQFDENSDDDIAPRKRSLTWDGASSWESQSDCCFEAETASTLCSDAALDEKSVGCATDVLTKDGADVLQSSALETDASVQGNQANDQQCYMPEGYMRFHNQFGIVAVQCVVAQPLFYVLQNLEDCSSHCTHATAAGADEVTECNDMGLKPAKKGLSGAQRRKVRKSAARSVSQAFSAEIVQS